MKNKILIYFATLATTIFLAGCTCSPSIINLSQCEMEKNPSGVYTLSMRSQVTGEQYVQNSGKGYIVIDGQKHDMTENCVGSNVWDFPYKFPQGHICARYYFAYEYDAFVNGACMHRCIESPVYNVKVLTKFVISMICDRGTVGSQIAIVGDGFEPSDKIVINGIEAQTTFHSKNSIEFTVPSLDAGCMYSVYLRGGMCDQYVGEFLVDAAKLTVMPECIRVCCGEKTMVLFTIEKDAPAGGLPVYVETDIPSSVLMPRVVIPAGSRTVSVPLEGGCAGEGRLYIGAAGYEECVVSITVE